MRHFGVDIELARVCSLSSAEAEAHGVGHLFTDNFNNIINDPEIDIVVELIGGTTIARTVVTGALAAGKNVVTANKALMATHGKEVMEAAEAAGKELAFEASVGGGIPIIDPLKHSLIANEITSVMGIVNGTTNYMLTRMADNGLSYEDALHEAQQKGFAEADPTADVGGFDAAAKIAILAFHRLQLARDLGRCLHRRHHEYLAGGYRGCSRHGLRHQASGHRPSSRGRGSMCACILP